MNNTSLLLKILFSCLLFAFVFTVFDEPVFANKTNSAQMTEEELRTASKSDGEAESLTSKASDPIGKEGAWGMKANFIIDRPANDVYNALKQIEKYAEFMEKVKRVEVLKRTSDGVIVEYTEGVMGFEMTSTQEWTFDPKKRTIIMKNIGKDDKAAFQEIQIQEVGHPAYSRVIMTVFADISWLPNFIMNWAISMAGKETASYSRKLVADILKSEKDNHNQ